MSDSTTIQLNVDNGIATLTLNRPEKRNAFSDAMRSELIEALEQVSRDEAIRALVVTGAGKGFCAGGDVAGMERRMQASAGDIAFAGWRRQQRVHHAVSLLYAMPKPTIAAVNGAAAGLGADMALSCDFVIASDAASFAWSYIKRGLIPDGGGLYLLPRRVGLPLAKELIFSGRRVDAAEALGLGIADRLTTVDRLLGDAHTWAEELSQGSPVALALGKTLLNRSFESDVDEILMQGSQAQAVCYTSTQHRESVRAFLELQSARKGVAA
jgi:enoyl-CoA hydratase/carnithine racemase